MKHESFTKTMCVLVFLTSPQWAQAASGELWETQSVMESKAHGQMNLGTNRECRPAAWRDNPEFKAPGANGECKPQQAQRRGDGYAWKFDCGATKGEANARLMGPDRMEGEMRMDSPQGRFTLRFSSRKVGTCTNNGRS